MEPYYWIVPRYRRWVLTIAFVVSLPLMGALRWSEPPGGWFALAFPPFHNQLGVNVAMWTATERERAFLGLGLDYVLMVIYPLLLSCACSYAAARWTRASYMRWPARTIWFAAPCDAVENAGLVAWLADPTTIGLAWTITVAAALKWLLVLAVCVLLGVALVRR